MVQSQDQTRHFMQSDLDLYHPQRQMFSSMVLKSLTHSLVHHFETVPNSKKLQTTTEVWLLRDFKILMRNVLLSQAVIQTPFNGGSPSGDAQADTRFTYFPSASGGDAGTSQQDATVALAAGQSGV